VSAVTVIADRNCSISNIQIAPPGFAVEASFPTCIPINSATLSLGAPFTCPSIHLPRFSSDAYQVAIEPSIDSYNMMLALPVAAEQQENQM
jgi:hypothetical protein